MPALMPSPTLRSLQRSCAFLGAAVPCSSHQTALLYLDLSENNATNFSSTEGGVLALATAVDGHPTLTELNLNHNRVERNTIVALAEALQRNSVLTALHLEDNGVDPKVWRRSSLTCSSHLDGWLLLRLGSVVRCVRTQPARAPLRLLQRWSQTARLHD